MARFFESASLRIFTPFFVTLESTSSHRSMCTVSFSFAKNTARQCDTSQDFGASLFSRLQIFSPLFSYLFYSLFFPFYFFPFYKSNFRCVFTKTIILLGLAEYEMIITNEALRASLVIYHLIFGAPS